MADPIGTYQGKPRRDDWPCGPKRPASGAERKPLAGWDYRGVLRSPGTIQVINVDEWWRVSLVGTVSGESASPRIAAEDAARAMVADMAAALGGSVTWADAEDPEGW